jgi:hypothetical protein
MESLVGAESGEEVTVSVWKNGCFDPEERLGRGAPLGGPRLRGGTQWGIGPRGLSISNKVQMGEKQSPPLCFTKGEKSIELERGVLRW